MATKWLKSALVPINGKGGGKGGVAQGQGTDGSRIDEAIAFAEKFAQMELK